MEEKVKIKLAQSLTSDQPEIIPFLPYLLQDFWELGSSPQEMLATFKKYIPTSKDIRVLDLACGKGAVSVRLAKELGVRCKGIDILPEFIDYASGKAREYGVSGLCQFIAEDVNLSLERERDYDCVIFGAVGDILGDYQETISKLLPTIRSKGFLLIDDAYVTEEEDNSRLQFEKAYPTYEQWRSCFARSGLKLIECKPGPVQTAAQVEQEMGWITARANELTLKYPAYRPLFQQYIVNQQSEYNDLQTDLISATWLAQKE